VSCRALAEDAHALAYATGRTVYDSMYVALAIRLNTRSITADDRLEAALRKVPAVARHIQLVQTFEA
jgi:predicted nucleic acid-binding protein